MPISSLRNELEEVSRSADFAIEEGRKKKEPARAGFATGIPIGGTTEFNAGGNTASSSVDRYSSMRSLQNAYLTCTIASASVDVIARTATAGGIEVVPLGTVYSDLVPPKATPQVKEVQELLRYVNPQMDIRQLMRGVLTDMLIFGDSFTEIVWVAGKPAALYPLDSTTISISADEHGTVKGYFQKTDTNRKTFFYPHEVIHVKFDTPGDTLYGVSPTQKAILPITTWLFFSALLQEDGKKGDPVRLHVDWPIALAEAEMKKLHQQFDVRNLGLKNLGNLFETKGGAQVKEIGVNQVTQWREVVKDMRDQILSEYGTPPSKVGIIEAGNIGGGSGTSQDRSFRINTIGPIQELIMEKFSWHLLVKAYDISDWTLRFGAVDWRDDEVIERIRDLRIRNGTWTRNRAAADIGEPPIPGGDDAVLIDRQNMVLWADLGELSKANLNAVIAATDAVTAGINQGTAAPTKGPTTSNAPVAPSTNAKTTPVVSKKPKTKSAATSQGPIKPPGAGESVEDDYDEREDFRYAHRVNEFDD
jgi:hypothetical protein